MKRWLSAQARDQHSLVGSEEHEENGRGKRMVLAPIGDECGNDDDDDDNVMDVDALMPVDAWRGWDDRQWEDREYDCDDEEAESDLLPQLPPLPPPSLNGVHNVVSSFPEGEPVREEVWIDHEGFPPPAAPLQTREDLDLLWKSVQGAGPQELVRCMLCRVSMKRCNWTHHMRRQHGDAISVCPYVMCGWKFAGGHMQSYRHMLRHHDSRNARCRDCPALLFDGRQTSQWRHEARYHRNWVGQDCQLEMGQDPLPEDDEGGARMDLIAAEHEEDEQPFYWDPPYQLGSSAFSCTTSPPHMGKTAGSRLGQCISGALPW